MRYNSKTLGIHIIWHNLGISLVILISFCDSIFSGQTVPISGSRRKWADALYGSYVNATTELYDLFTETASFDFQETQSTVDAAAAWTNFELVKKGGLRFHGMVLVSLEKPGSGEVRAEEHLFFPFFSS